MFAVNGDLWRVALVPDGSERLRDRTGSRCLGCTDPKHMTVWLSDSLSGDMLDRVLLHEIGHCVIWSFDLFGQIRRFARPSKQIEAEEWVCNFAADYGALIFDSARRALGRPVADLPPYIAA